MKKVQAMIVVGSLLLGLHAAGEDGGISHVLHFLNQDLLHGHLERVDAANRTLSWRYPSARQPFEFTTKDVRQVTLVGAPLTNSAQEPSVLWLTNGDMLHGRVARIDEDTLDLDTWFAGTLRIRRNMVALLEPDRAGSLIYEGPDASEDWVRDSQGGAWTFDDGALVTTHRGGVGRMFESLPEKCRIVFDMEWNGGLNFFFSFYTADHRRHNRNAYSLHFSGNTVHPHHFGQWGNTQAIGEAKPSAILEPSADVQQARVELFANRTSGEITVSINGQLLNTWMDQHRTAELGEGVAFFSMMPEMKLKILHLRIEEWKGILPFADEPHEEVERDMLHLINDDKVTGHLQEMQDGVITFQTAFAEIKIPIERVRLISFASGPLERAARRKHDIQAHFAGQGVLTFSLHRIAEGEIEGSSDNFGVIRVPLRAFRSLRFNIYEEG